LVQAAESQTVPTAAASSAPVAPGAPVDAKHAPRRAVIAEAK
jgi:hypothetical protein